MKIHVASETKYFFQGNGVHTAFIDHIGLLKSKNDVDVVVNQEGWGDVFHSHTYGPYYFLKGIPYKGKRVFTAHVIPDSIKGSIPFSTVLMPFVKWYLKQVYSYADVCLAISPMVEYAIRDLGAKTEIVRLGNPIPMERWARTNEKKRLGRKFLGLDENEFVVLGVGQLQARKGVEDFMDIAESIPEARFVWAGGRPFKMMTEGVGRIDSRIEHASSNIQFTGMLDLEQMPLIYAAADIMLFPSYQENCPMAPMEAAACGMPVVFRDLQEYKTLYESAYLKAATTDDFIQMTRKLMTDKTFFEAGNALSKNLVQQFDKDVIRKKLLNLYERLNDQISNLTPNLIGWTTASSNRLWRKQR